MTTPYYIKISAEIIKINHIDSNYLIKFEDGHVIDTISENLCGNLSSEGNKVFYLKKVGFSSENCDNKRKKVKPIIEIAKDDAPKKSSNKSRNFSSHIESDKSKSFFKDNLYTFGSHIGTFDSNPFTR
jgi:hypothetical protein